MNCFHFIMTFSFSKQSALPPPTESMLQPSATLGLKLREIAFSTHFLKFNRSGNRVVRKSWLLDEKEALRLKRYSAKHSVFHIEWSHWFSSWSEFFILLFQYETISNRVNNDSYPLPRISVQQLYLYKSREFKNKLGNHIRLRMVVRSKVTEL